MLLKGLALSPEKGILACSPILLYAFLVLISKLGDFRIEEAAYYVSWGFCFMIGFHEFTRLGRLIYVLSDIKAAGHELEHIPLGLDNPRYIYNIYLTDQDFNTHKVSSVYLPQKSPCV